MDELKAIEDLFQAAADLPAAERGEFLERTCADPRRRERVLALLARLDEGASLQPFSLDGPAGTETEPGERPGTRIGRYKLLQHLGDGGFGSVWMAEQEEPVVRKVALKIIKLGMDTREVVARFEAERQALAMMDHPNIARVFDGGATESGRPYFVMELVRGISITEYADHEKLDTRARLELFCEVCHAVQHAHQKGVIHRDLKPSNVMVTLHDGRPVPKVIDFGIAKAMHSRLTEKTLFTQYRHFIGTPVYMSPEQAEMSGLDVDTRADIYSLGVLLYELLTGTTPFDVRALLERGYGEIQRVIREEEPPKPSVRVSTLGDASTSIAALRRLDATALRRRLQGDLDWIVMRALEKDRGRRYATAKEFAEDVRRHLEDEPVAAGPPSALYRLRKFLVKNRMAVGWAATIAIALLAGIVGTTWGMVEAAHQRDDAITARELAEARRVAADEARSSEQEARLRAEDAAHAALAVTSYLQGTLALTNPAVAGAPELSVRDLLDQASATVSDTLADQPLAEALVRSTIGRAYESLNELELADAHLRRAAELMAARDDVDGLVHYETLWALTEVSFRLGRPDAYEMATEARRVGHAQVALTHRELAAVLDRFILATDEQDPGAALLQFSVAEPLARRELPPGDPLWLIVADTWRHAGYSWWYTPVESQSEPFWRAALEIHRRELPANHPTTAETLSLLVGLLNRTGRASEAEAELRETLVHLEEMLGPDSVRVAFARSMLGENLAAQGRFAEAEELLLSSNEVLSRSGDATNFYPVDAVKRLVVLYDAWGRPEAAAPWRARLVHDLAIARYVSPFSIAQPAFAPENSVLLEAVQALDAWAMGTADGSFPAPAAPEAKIGDLVTERARLYEADSDAALLLARFLVAWSGALGERAPASVRLSMLDEGLEVLAAHGQDLPLDVADGLAQRSLLLGEAGAPSRADEDARAAWQALQRFEGESPWWDAQSLVRIARALAARGLSHEAEGVLLSSHAVLERQLGPRHKETAAARAALHDLYTSWGRPEEAARYLSPDIPR